jgi:hypothetical protein
MSQRDSWVRAGFPGASAAAEVANAAHKSHADKGLIISLLASGGNDTRIGEPRGLSGSLGPWIPGDGRVQASTVAR